MESVFHSAASRGHQDHGWLRANHSFSFANWHNPERMNFGALRVLNDDYIAPGRGFSTHPHDNMEIISIPLSGDLEHHDSMGHSAVIREGDIQIISAGTGIYHSEKNKRLDQAVELLQLWIFPNQKDVSPRYDQISIRALKKENEFYTIVSPVQNDQGSWIYQNAWMYLGDFTKETTLTHPISQPKNGVYAFVIKGEAKIDHQQLNERDAMGIWNTEKFTVHAKKGSRILLIDVPLTV
ncbi:MAG: pirin family protein [Flavobacteriaceae bacterium]